MNKIRQTFLTRKCFLPFTTAYFPNKGKFFDILSILSDQGVDIIEIGFPFSDPVADGPVIQKSSQIALENDFLLSDFFESFLNWRQKYKTPCLIMTYSNLIYQYGPDAFLTSCVSCQIEGLIVPDLPPENRHLLFSKLDGPAFTYLVCEETSEARVRSFSDQDLGFIYYVSRLGVTGSGGIQIDFCRQNIQKIKSLVPSLPVAVGFGVSSPDQAQQLFSVADGVIVGSAIVRYISEHHQDKDFNQQFSKWIADFIYKG